MGLSSLTSRKLSSAAESGLAGMALGRLTTTSVSPISVALEIVLLPLIALGLGFIFSPEDPLWIDAGFPWSWLAPAILALRYGPLAGLGSAAILLLAWLFTHVGHFDAFPKLYFLGGLILTMLVGEFSSLWLTRTRRAETVQVYLEQRLEHLTRQYYLLRLSHDRLEQDLIGRPMSMRDALETLHQLGDQGDRKAGGQTLLRLLAQYCQLEIASLHRVDDNETVGEALASIGSNTPLAADDPMLRQAMDSRSLCHIAQLENEQRLHSRYLIVAPLINLNGDIHGVLTVEELPFFSLQDETLQTINLLLSYYTDGLAMHALSAPVCAALPACPPEFAFEAQRLWHLRQNTGISSIIVALEFQPQAVEQDFPIQLMRLKRTLDEHWLCAGQKKMVLATLMPLGNNSTAEGFLNRLETWAEQTSESTLAGLGISAHSFILAGETTIDTLRRIQELADG